MMNIYLSPEGVLRKNLCLIIILLAANLIGVILKIFFNHDYVFGFGPLFNFNTEMNVPTLYSSVALICASALLFVVGYLHKKINLSYIPWFGLSFIFLFLSIDETASIHEGLTVPVKETLNTSGLLFYAWVIPYSIGLMIFLIIYSKFLINLPKQTMILFIVSGSIYVTGAIGFELLGGQRAEQVGPNGLIYSLFYTCEELLEMLGIALFIYALLTYLVNKFDVMNINITRLKQ